MKVDEKIKITYDLEKKEKKEIQKNQTRYQSILIFKEILKK